jgi:hypothetical protein
MVVLIARDLDTAYSAPAHRMVRGEMIGMRIEALA